MLFPLAHEFPLLLEDWKIYWQLHSKIKELYITYLAAAACQDIPIIPVYIRQPLPAKIFP